MTRRLCYILLLTIWCVSASSQRLKLFSSDMRESLTAPQKVVIDFLERYFQELPSVKETTMQVKMADDKVFFRRGKLSDLYHVNDTMGFSFYRHEKYYEANWLKAGEPVISVVFPAQYDLLLGQNKQVVCEKMKETILAAPNLKVENDIPDDLMYQDDNIWKSQRTHLELESLNDAIYYNKVGESWQPVFDCNHLAYSAVNLFHGLIPDADYRMYVEQSVYDMKTVNYTISFRQWLDYCAEWGLKVYFAVEEEREDGILALVIAHSRELGFNHLLSVVIPDKFVNDKNAVLKVRLTPYIPANNVKDLYKQETSKLKKKK